MMFALRLDHALPSLSSCTACPLLALASRSSLLSRKVRCNAWCSLFSSGRGEHALTVAVGVFIGWRQDIRHRWLRLRLANSLDLNIESVDLLLPISILLFESPDLASELPYSGIFIFQRLQVLVWGEGFLPRRRLFCREVSFWS